jgi:hypothetical protein
LTQTAANTFFPRRLIDCSGSSKAEALELEDPKRASIGLPFYFELPNVLSLKGTARR